MASEGSPDLAKCLPLAQTPLSHLEGGSPVQGPAEAGLGRGLGGPSTRPGPGALPRSPARVVTALDWTKQELRFF